MTKATMTKCDAHAAARALLAVVQPAEAVVGLWHHFQFYGIDRQRALIWARNLVTKTKGRS